MPVPTVTTDTLVSVIAEGLIAHGTVKADGGDAVTQHGHVWATNPDPTIIADSKTELGTKPNLGQFQSKLTDLTPGTLYYVRAYATNVAAGTAYGANLTDTTLTVIGRRYWWAEDEDWHYFGESGTERKLQGVDLTGDHDTLGHL
ncbi:hypothetical protein LCGC14_2036930 [marine sediment metagenome]|uniref:Fibronectin type-III domain-containing protein n=1 Tax=marine sediment metagenome TaxID=412755 RepID=A0A0F9ET80_9ZZZZ